TVGRYGVIKMVQREGRLLLVSDDPLAIEEVWRAEKVRRLCAGRPAPGEIEGHPLQRGHVKQALIHHGFPVDDQAGYVEGRKLAFQLRTVTRKGEPFRLRPYQKDAVELSHAGGGAHGGSGVVVLPCGAGKTVVGIAAMEKLQCETLILASNVTAARQW